jgi:hypothetical protein
MKYRVAGLVRRSELDVWRIGDDAGGVVGALALGPRSGCRRGVNARGASHLPFVETMGCFVRFGRWQH